MAELSLPGFNRRYVLLPMLAAIALVVSAYFITEQRRTDVMLMTEEIRAGQERMRVLAETIYAAADAESGQRGYLLTLDPEYLAPYDDAKTRIDQHLLMLTDLYKSDAAESAHIERVKVLVAKKFAEMQATIDWVKTAGGNATALKVVKTDLGLRWMEQVRAEIEGISSRERARIYEEVKHWEAQNLISRYIAGGGALLNVLLLLLVGTLVTRDLERRTLATNRLDQIVAERTAELGELSTHLQQVTEHEKSRLARELHDELGGLLVAIKMDLSQLAKKVDITHPDIQVRWQRIQAALSAGVELKRRVIEELRPTLLDNMGLIAALRWQAEQTCAQAGIALDADFPEEEQNLDANIAIAVFRIAQETLTNMVKHARATAVTLELKVSPADMVLIIEDNGIGISVNVDALAGSHGLLSMKYRMQSIGGSFYIGPATPKGTRVVVRVPLELANAMASLN